MPADLNDYFNKKNANNDKKSGFNFKKPNLPNFSGGFGKLSGIIYAIIIIVAILIIAKPFIIINSGEVGIKSTAGKYDASPLQPGLHFFMPFIQAVSVVDTKVRIINYTSIEGRNEANYRGSGIETKDTISVLDSRGLQVSMDITVQYRLNPQNAPQTIATWGFSWESKLIDPAVRNVVRNVTGKYTAEELPEKRNDIAVAIDTGIRTDIENQLNKPVELLSVQLREIILPPKVKEQIERVQIAKQEAERTKYEVERANQEALKKAALSRGTAEAAKIEAQGRADALKIEANAQSYANKEIASSLTQNLLQLKQIQTQREFNEALKVNKDAKIFLTPGGSVPNIWVDTKDRLKQSSAVEK